MISPRFLISLLAIASLNSLHGEPSHYRDQAREVTQYIQKTFWNDKSSLYAGSATNRAPDFMWGNGVVFSALAGATRHEPSQYAPLMLRFFQAMDRYWDTKAKIPGYEPAPTRGGGHDKYYDDNAWMVLTYLEAYELTHVGRYLTRARETLKFVLSGWDAQGGGGIWWHETHKGGCKNTCINAPAAVACLRIAKFTDPASARTYRDMAKRLVDWTKANLQASDGLFEDSKTIATGAVNHAKLTYNSALMLRAFLGLYRNQGKPENLQEAQRIALAADGLLSKKTGTYRDAVKWSHLMIEADLELYRATKENYLRERAAKNADYYYAAWKSHPPSDLIANASIARLLWLMADSETPAGARFWSQSDKP